jgi:hypothetical protein
MVTRDSVTDEKDARDVFLESCYPIEVSTSARSMGHCSDLVYYIQHAGARLSPQFDEETLKKHVELCPRSIRLHNQYPIHFMFQDKRIRNYWLFINNEGLQTPKWF